MNVLRLVAGALVLAGVAAGSAAGSAGRAAPNTGAIPGRYIVVLEPGADRAAAVAYARSRGGYVFMQYRYALNGFAVRLPEVALRGIERNPDVMFVSPDEEVHASACDPTAAHCLPTGIDRIDADRRSTKSGDGRGSVNVNVGIIDSGIDPSHPDLNVAGGVNCSTEKNFADLKGTERTVPADNNSTDFENTVPAAYDEVLTVTGMTDFDGVPGGLASPVGSCVPPDSKYLPLLADDTAVFFGNFAVLPSDQAHTVAAPAVCIFSTDLNGTYSFESGTSIASPHAPVQSPSALLRRHARGLRLRRSFEKSLPTLPPTARRTRATALAAIRCTRSAASTTATNQHSGLLAGVQRTTHVCAVRHQG
jgi:Peptidase inhibitor I9